MTRWRLTLLITAAAAALGGGALALSWDWNWFRPMLEERASALLGRPVQVGGIAIELGRVPTLTLDDLTIGNPAGFPPGPPLATVGRLTLRIDAAALWDRAVRLPEIAIERPVVELRRAPSGEANWTFPALAAADDGKAETPPPEIGNLVISDGRVHVADPSLKANFDLTVHTEPAPREGAESPLVVDAKGTYAGQPITGRFIGGSVLSLRDGDKPYPVDLKAAHGATRIAIKGSIERPLDFGGARLVLDLRGSDLADIYALTGIPVAPTPPYHLEGRLDYAQGKIRVDDIAGTVGGSDLSGTLAIDRSGERPLVTADLASRKLVLADLAGFIGAAPGKEGAANETKQQKLAHAREDANPKLLPDTPINLPKLRSADLKVTYRGARIEGTSLPLDDLSVSVAVENGRVTVSPLSFGVGKGQIAANLTLDGQHDPVRAKGDIAFRRIDLHRLMASSKTFDGVGTISGEADIDTTGNSLAQMLGRGNGSLRLFMNGGEISALLVNLAGLDFGRSVLSALGLPNQAPIRCMAADFGLKRGVLETRTMLFDTTEANIVGKGSVDLRDETVDYQVSTDPKHFSIGSLPAPIDITGPLKKPSIKPDPTALGLRVGAAAVLGVVLTPLAALLPTIQLGLGEDNDCGKLLAAAKAPAKPAVPRKPAKRVAGKAAESLPN